MSPATTLSDADLVHASLGGDLHAFETLIHRYQQVIYLDVLRYLREPMSAQDIVQETFLTAFQQLSRLSDGQKFGPWLHSAARRRCLNTIRTQRRTAAAYRQWQEDCADVTLEPDIHPDTMDDSAVHALLTHLPAASVQAVLMYYIDDLPVATIAQRLGMSSQAVKQRLYRARRQLHEEVITMVKDTKNRNQLPAGIPGRVIAKILEEGRQDWLHMRYDRANTRFREALDAAPDDADALLAYGTSYDPMSGARPEHVEVLERAAEQAPTSVPVLHELASAYWQCERKDDWTALSKKGLDLCDKHLAVNPKDLEALKSKAEILRFREDFAGAEQLLRIAHEEAPEDQEVLHFLALNISRQDRYEEAATLYEQNYALNRKTVWAYGALRNLSTDLAFRRQGDPAQAVAYAEEVWALTERPNEAGNLIYFYSATEQLDEAVRVFESISIPQHHPRVYVTVGIGYMRQGKWEKAQKTFQSAVDLTTDDCLRAEAYLHLAYVLFASDQSEAARVALDAGLSLNPDARSTILTGGTKSIFQRPWTTWLSETLEQLIQHDARVTPLLQAVRDELQSVDITL